MKILKYIYVATRFNYYNMPYNVQLINTKIICPYSKHSLIPFALNLSNDNEEGVFTVK